MELTATCQVETGHLFAVSVGKHYTNKKKIDVLVMLSL